MSERTRYDATRERKAPSARSWAAEEGLGLPCTGDRPVGCHAIQSARRRNGRQACHTVKYVDEMDLRWGNCATRAGVTQAGTQRKAMRKTDESQREIPKTSQPGQRCFQWCWPLPSGAHTIQRAAALCGLGPDIDKSKRSRKKKIGCEPCLTLRASASSACWASPADGTGGV